MNDSIGAFGDSILKGIAYDELRGRYSFLENSFAEIFMKNTGYQVDNYAKFGCTISKGGNLIEKFAEKLPGYRYTFLEFGGNDCDFNWAAVSGNPERNHLANTPISDFENLYSGIIDRVKAAGSVPVLFSLPPLDADRYFSWISRGLSGENILSWLGDVSHIYRWHERYNLVVIKLAALKEVPLIDIREAFLESRNYQKLFCLDGIHPNEAGHSMIYRTIRNCLERLE